MESSTEKYNLPESIYFDTNIIRKIPFSRPETEYNKFRYLVKEMNADLFIPEMAVLEYTHGKLLTLNKRLQNLKNYRSRSAIFCSANRFAMTISFILKIKSEY